MTLDIRRRDDGRTCLVELEGEVDLATSTQLREQLLAILETGVAGVVLDLDGVPFLDSTGLGVMVAAYKRAESLGIPFCLARPQRIVANALTLVRIDTVIPVHTRLEDGVAHVNRAPTEA